MEEEHLLVSAAVTFIGTLPDTGYALSSTGQVRLTDLREQAGAPVRRHHGDRCQSRDTVPPTGRSVETRSLSRILLGR